MKGERGERGRGRERKGGGREEGEKEGEGERKGREREGGEREGEGVRESGREGLKRDRRREG